VDISIENEHCLTSSTEREFTTCHEERREGTLAQQYVEDN